MSDSTNILVDVDLEPSTNPETLTAIRLSQKQSCDRTNIPPNEGCGSPEYAEDESCDDENNNAGCNWDDGACCDNDYPWWDYWCEDCKCLDPNQKRVPFDRTIDVQ